MRTLAAATDLPNCPLAVVSAEWAALVVWVGLAASVVLAEWVA
jgi:hypothetical protein